MKLYDMTITDFLNELSRDVPAPGGGSVAALNGAQGAALFSMVAEMTVRKATNKGLTADVDVINVLNAAKDAQAKFIQFIQDDTDAFMRVMDAVKLPKSTDEEKAARKEAIQLSYKGAIMPPLEVVRLAYSFAKQYSQIIYEKGDKFALSDVCVGVRCLNTAFWSAIYNVKINLSSITDTDFAANISTEIAMMEKDIDEFCHSVIGHVEF